MKEPSEEVKRVEQRYEKALDDMEKHYKDVLDKVRAEIEHVIDYTYDSTDYDKALYNRAYKDGLYEALEIIDKYREERGI